ncbi:hypothetical protein VP501E541_P0192 [Vibrio phage 501E54-1]|nr:hypothetical protein VP501E541_P0192 [Vibrio phage 501E54-1]
MLSCIHINLLLRKTPLSFYRQGMLLFNFY